MDQPGVYGTIGVEAATNCPGSRQSLAMAVHTVSGIVLVHGGIASDSVGAVSKYPFCIKLTDKA